MIWAGYDPDTDTVDELSVWTWILTALGMVAFVTIGALVLVLALR